jgi:hypothetical protein
VDIVLVYRDELAVNGNAALKHKIRLNFSRQLQHLWENEQVLRDVMGNQAFVPAVLERTRIELTQPHLGPKYAHARVQAFGYRLLPLLTRFNGLVCHLDIEFLRREEPGRIFQRADIDARLKTLLDALRMPQCPQEVPDDMQGQNNEYLYCLMEDDSLVTKVTIDTQRLRTPKDREEPNNYAEIRVKALLKIQRPHHMTEVGYQSL